MNGTTSSLHVANSAFMHNSAFSGGALYAQYCNNVIAWNNLFLNSTASNGNGGHIFLVRRGKIDSDYRGLCFSELYLAMHMHKMISSAARLCKWLAKQKTKLRAGCMELSIFRTVH